MHSFGTRAMLVTSLIGRIFCSTILCSTYVELVLNSVGTNWERFQRMS